MVVVFPGCALAQASAYVPLDDVAYTYVDALMARRAFRELSALERPYTEGALRTAIDSARTKEPSAVINSYLDALYAAVEKYAVRPGNSDTLAAQTFRARATGDVYVTAQTSGRRELMLADTITDARPGGAVRLLMAGGPVVGFTRVLIDSRLNVDPEFTGKKDRKLAGRTEDGYVGGQWKYAQLSFGRVGRNWGPPTQFGLMLGNYAYTYDHLYGLIGTDKIHWSTVIAKLDNIVPPTGPEVERYFSIHRIALHLEDWELAGSESYVYGGVGRGFEPSLANPFNVYGLSWRDEQQEGNLGLGGEVALRTDRFGNFAGQLFIDDLQIDHKCSPACKQPSSYGLTLTAEGLPLRGDQRWFASYTRVSNLAYNNKNPNEHYEVFGVGLGRGFNDYDEARIGADLALVPRTPLKLYVAHRRQGEGSYNLSFPLPADYATTPGIFSGVVMGVTRVGISGASRWRDLEVSGDVGLNHSTNHEHVSGSTRTGFEGRVRVAIEPRWSVNF
ncbi:MAG: hypothetical protein ABI408_14045 [Gemmatimonadaceae bacterium]